MPTGKLPGDGLFEKLVEIAEKHDLLIVHDNPYSFILNDNPISILSVKGSKAVTLELNSLSKSHNMAGWRIGMLCGDEARISEVLRYKSNSDSGMFLPLQLAAAEALRIGKEWHKEQSNIYAERRNKVYELLEKINCSYQHKQAGLFTWAKVPANFNDGFKLSDNLLYNSGVFITPGGIFGTEGNNFIRVSLCNTIAIYEEAIQRIKQ